MKLSILFVFCSVLCLLIGVKCLSYSASLKTPKFSYSRMKGNLKNQFKSHASNTLKYSSKMALSLEKIQENNQLWQNVSQELQIESEESSKQHLITQIKSITKQQRLTKKLINNTEILEKIAKTKDLQASYQKDLASLRNHLNNLIQTKKELKKLLARLSAPESNETSDEIKKAKEDIQGAQLVTKKLERDRKKKENDEFQAKAARFMVRKLNKKRVNLRGSKINNVTNESKPTLLTQLEAAYLAKSTLVAFLLNLGSEYCLKEDLSSQPPTNCPNNYERITDLVSFCRELCPDFHSLCGSLCYEDCTHVCTRNVGYSSAHSYSTIGGGARCKCINENSIYPRETRSINYIFNNDSRVSCTSAPYTYKFGDKCYQGCYQSDLQDCSISLCGRNCESGSAEFNIETFKLVRNAINEGLIVHENNTSAFSEEFLYFYQKKLPFASYSRAITSVKRLISNFLGYEDVWAEKFKDSAYSAMPESVAGRFLNKTYVNISSSMIGFLKNWGSKLDPSKPSPNVPQAINFELVALEIKDCTVGCLGSEIQKLRCATLILEEVIQKISLIELVAIERTFGTMLCQKKVNSDIVWATGGKNLKSRTDHAITISSETYLPEFFELKVKIVEMENKDIVIGLSKKKYDDLTFDAAGKWLANIDGEYGYNGKGTGYKFSFPDKQELYGQSCLVGETLTIAYRKDRTLSFYRNDYDMGVAFQNVVGPFYLAATFFTYRTNLEIVSCKVL